MASSFSAAVEILSCGRRAPLSRRGMRCRGRIVGDAAGRLDGDDGNDEKMDGVTSPQRANRYSETPQRAAWRKKYRQLLPFVEVKKMVQAQGMKSEADWLRMISDGRKNRYWPSDPQSMYTEEWVSWEDFLGTPLPFKEAREIVRMLRLESQDAWWAWTTTGPGRDPAFRIPCRPHDFYQDEWNGFDDWLGVEPTPLVFDETAQRAWEKARESGAGSEDEGAGGGDGGSGNDSGGGRGRS